MKITASVVEIPNLSAPATGLTGVLDAARLNWPALPKVTVSTTAPTSPATNDIWIDTTA